MAVPWCHPTRCWCPACSVQGRAQLLVSLMPLRDARWLLLDHFKGGSSLLRQTKGREWGGRGWLREMGTSRVLLTSRVLWCAGGCDHGGHPAALKPSFVLCLHCVALPHVLLSCSLQKPTRTCPVPAGTACAGAAELAEVT